MQLYLRPFYNILRQPNIFGWATEHQKRFEEIKAHLTKQLSNTIPGPDQHFMPCAMPQTLASAQHYYNLTMEQIKRTSLPQTLD